MNVSVNIVSNFLIWFICILPLSLTESIFYLMWHMTYLYFF